MSNSAIIDAIVPPCQEHAQCPYESYVKYDIARRKARKMTFQIGLFGSDGMLLAGDTKSSESGVPAVPRNNEDMRYSEVEWGTSVATKFMCKMNGDKEDLSMVVAQCGDPIARLAASEILNTWDRVEHRTASIVIDDLYAKVYPPHSYDRRQATDLLIVRHAEREMLRCTTVGGYSVPPIAHKEGKVITGRAPSLALLFVEKFLVPAEHTIEELKPIAAYTVWLTGQLNRIVEGLEMIVFPDGKPAKKIQKPELQELEAGAMVLHENLKRTLFGK